jgi:hypothetical protein
MFRRNVLPSASGWRNKPSNRQAESYTLYTGKENPKDNNMSLVQHPLKIQREISLSVRSIFVLFISLAFSCFLFYYYMLSNEGRSGFDSGKDKRDFSLPHSVPDRLWGPSSLHWVPGLSPGVKVSDA